MLKLFIVVLMTCACLPSKGYGDDTDIYSDLGSLVGSRYSQLRQNLEADRSGLIRLENDKELAEAKKQGLLVKLSSIPNVRVEPKLGKKFRYVLPWTAAFLKEHGDIFQANFNKDFPLSSAVRTVVRQKQIAKRGNGNAAPPTGDTRSAHLTGAAIDIPKKRLSRAQIKWLRERLSDLELKGLLEATEEHKQLVFHVTVYERYESSQVRIASN